MLDMFTRNGYKLETDGEMFNVIEPNGNIAGTYHPMQGDSILGQRTPSKVVEIMEALEDGRRMLSRDHHPLQCEW